MSDGYRGETHLTRTEAEQLSFRFSFRREAVPGSQCIVPVFHSKRDQAAAALEIRQMRIQRQKAPRAT